MHIDVAICTWNRARLLELTLQSLTQLEIPPGTTWRVLVVDNNSTDSTDSVLDRFARKLPLVALRETAQGHCFARNQVIANAQGDLMLWTDDDVRVDPRWLSHYVHASISQPEIVFWGGPIRPEFIDPAPTWIRENWQACRGCFAERDLGAEPVEFDMGRLPYGANFAVRRAVQAKFPFNVSLGRVGNRVVGEDELDVMRRMLAAGHRGRYVPQAAVDHLIDARRTSEKYLFEYYVGQGAIVEQRQRQASSAQSLESQSEKYWRRRAVCHRLMYRIKRPWSKSPAWVAHLIEAGLATGRADFLAKARSAPATRQP